MVILRYLYVCENCVPAKHRERNGVSSSGNVTKHVQTTFVTDRYPHPTPYDFF